MRAFVEFECTSNAQLQQLQSTVAAHVKMTPFRLRIEDAIKKVLPTIHAGATSVRKGWVLLKLLRLIQAHPGCCTAELAAMPGVDDMKPSSFRAAMGRARRAGLIKTVEADNEGRGGNYITAEGTAKLADLESKFVDAED